MGNENMAPGSGKEYRIDGKIVSTSEHHHPSRRAIRVTRGEEDDQSLSRIFNLGNFGTALEADTGLPNVQQSIISRAALTSQLVPPGMDYNFVLTGFTLMFKTNVETFGNNKVVQIMGYRDGYQIFNQQYRNLIHLSSLAANFQYFKEATKVTGVVYDLYFIYIELEGDVDGLVLRNDDYFEFGIYDITNPETPILTTLDIPQATISAHGFLSDRSEYA